MLFRFVETTPPSGRLEVAGRVTVEESNSYFDDQLDDRAGRTGTQIQQELTVDQKLTESSVPELTNIGWSIRARTVHRFENVAGDTFDGLSDVTYGDLPNNTVPQSRLFLIHGDPPDWLFTDDVTFERISGDANVVYNDIVCFGAGTLIAAAGAPVAVEALSPGDLVRTADGALRPIRWVGSRSFGAAEMSANPNHCPVRIAAGAMGKGLPERDLWVSRQHMLLVSGRVVKRLWGVAEALVPAVHLVGLPGIAIDRSRDRVTYVHLLCDRHELLLAEGCVAESLYLGPMVSRDPESLGMQPQLPVPMPGMTPARLVLSGRMAKRLRARLARNAKPPLAEPAAYQGC